MQRTRIHLEQTESTNDIGSQWLRTASPGEILTIWTSNQTHGRGQRGKTWELSPGLDLAWTAAVKWPANALTRDPIVLNKAVTSSIRNAIAQFVADAQGERSVGIKWPNDILIRNEADQWLKCAGILIENTWRASTWDGMLIGVGVNVNSAQTGAQRRCALCEFTTTNLAIERVEAQLSEHVLDALLIPEPSQGFSEHLVGRDQREKYRFQGKTGIGIIKTVSANGALEMEWTPEGGATKQLTVERSEALEWDWLWRK